MAIIGTLALSVVARTQKLRRGLRSAESSIKKFAGRIASAGRRVAAFGSAIAAAAIALTVLLTRAELKATDRLAKMSRALGLATEEMSSLRLAAGLTGTDMEGVIKAVRRMEKNVSDAQLGLTTAVRAFDALGLSAENLAKMAPLDQLKAIADRFGTLTDQADKARVAQDLFGRSGVELINMLALGSKGIDDLQKKAARFGLTITDFDARQIEAVNDAFLLLKLTVSGFFRRLAVGIAPIVTTITSEIAELSRSAASMGTQVGDFISRVVIGSIEAVAEGVREIRMFILGLKRDILDLELIRRALFGGDGMEGLADQIVAIEREIARLERAGHGFGIGDRLRGDLEQFRLDIENAMKAGVRPAMDDFDDLLDRVDMASRELHARSVRSFSSVNTAASRTSDLTRQIAGNTRDSVKATREVERAVERMDDRVVNAIQTGLRFAVVSF